MVNTEAIHDGLGIIGNVTAFIRLVSPLPTFSRILKNRSVEEFTFHPYVAGIMNCIMWVFYSMPFVHPHSIPVTTINTIGFFMNAAYVFIYWRYTETRKRRSITLYLVEELVVLASIACLTLLVFQSHTARSNFLGIFCDLFGILFYGSPLTVMSKVIETKSVEFMPLYLCLTGFVNGIVWSAYALIRFDLYILISNIIGTILGALQLILYAYYYNSTPKSNKGSSKLGPVQLSTGEPQRETVVV